MAAGEWPEAFEIPGKAIWHLQNGRKCLAAGAPPWTPLGELTALSQTPSWWGGGWLPLPKNPTPALSLSGLGLRPFGPRLPPPPELKSCLKPWWWVMFT